MSAQLTSGKASALLTRVQRNPEIGTDNETWVADLIQRAAEGFVRDVRFRRYPELSKGFSESVASASTDISSAGSNSLTVSVNGSAFFEVNPTLAELNTGDKIATELQTIIQADSTDGADEVTVVFANTKYTATSGRYGVGSTVQFSWLSEALKHVAQKLGLSPTWGGIEVFGSAAREEADDVVVEMTEILYRKAGLEGIQSGTVPGDITFSMHEDELSANARRILTNMRRVYP